MQDYGGIPIVAKYKNNSQPSIALLSSSDSRHIYNAFNALKGDLPNLSQDCLQNVVGRLQGAHTGFQVGDFLRYLEQGAFFFDGVHSTVPIKGIVAPAQGNYYYSLNLEFSHSHNGFQTKVLTSSISPVLMVFFNNDQISGSHDGVNSSNLALLFHEALHGFTAYSHSSDYYDPDLLSDFGLNVNGPSDQITKFIQQHCFK